MMGNAPLAHSRLGVPAGELRSFLIVERHTALGISGVNGHRQRFDEFAVPLLGARSFCSAAIWRVTSRVMQRVFINSPFSNSTLESMSNVFYRSIFAAQPRRVFPQCFATAQA